MKQVIESFGGAIVALIVAGGLMVLLQALPVSLGQIALSTIGADMVEAPSNQAFVEYITTQEWKVRIPEHLMLWTGRIYQMQDILRVSDPEGVVCDVRLAMVQQESLSSGRTREAAMVLEDGGACVFSEAGVYQLTLDCSSAKYGQHIRVIRLVVNEEVA